MNYHLDGFVDRYLAQRFTTRIYGLEEVLKQVVR